MANDSEAARNGRLARCPHCRAFNGVTAKHSLAATRCSSCRTEFWYVCVEQHVFSYDKSAMSNSAWEGVVRHVPQSEDDSIALVEKIMYLESEQN